MAKIKKHSRKRSRRNPADTLLVNPRRGGKSRRVKRSPKRSGLSLFGRMKRALGIKRNPLLANPKRRRKSVKRRSARRNPLLANPLLANPKRRRKSVKRSRSRGRARRNPLLANPLLANPKRRKGSHKRKRSGAKRRNPSGMLALPAKAQQRVQKLAKSIPLVGGLLGGAIGVIGGALGGALGVLPTSYAMPYVAQYVPSMLKPFGYSIAGALLSSAVRMIPVKIPYKAELAVGIAAAGGAVDMYRWQHGKSQDLGDEYGDEYGDDDMGDDDMGDIGDDGSALAAIEYADADLADAEHMGDDFSSDEMAAADLGRRGFWARFRPKKGQDDEPVAEGVSEHAGKEGRRHGFLIYWIGFENFRRLTKLAPKERQDAIAHMKSAAQSRATKLLEQKLDTSIQQAETAGLLVAA